VIPLGVAAVVGLGQLAERLTQSIWRSSRPILCQQSRQHRRLVVAEEGAERARADSAGAARIAEEQAAAIKSELCSNIETRRCSALACPEL